MSDIAYTTTITADLLAEHLIDARWVIVDCRFDLADPTAGESQYHQGHIPGAVYAHLERDLSVPMGPLGEGGRHPLPSPAQLTDLFGRLGIGTGVQVVAYDDTSGHYAARLWWMLRFMGHEAVAVLDGGWNAWLTSGYSVETDIPTARPRLFEGAPRWDRVIEITKVESAPLLVDSRTPERYLGESEPIDPVAGHIPGATNRPYSANWTSMGRWRAPESLLGDYLELLGSTPPEEVVFYCGSGVSACVNLLGMVKAGLPEGRLYVGSWSEWSRMKKNAS